VITIQLQFPAGRLHATPWGRHVNEGAIEWPPSPWRLLRALLAVWHHKFPDTPRENMEPLIAALTAPPSFHLPPASQGHTRHYMPIANHGTSKIFDTFVVIPRSERIIVCWPDAELDNTQRELLSQMLVAMGYFGRAESWIEATLLDDWQGEFNAVPLNGSAVAENQQLERLLVAQPADVYSHWHQDAAAQRSETLLAEKREKAAAKGKSTDSVRLTAADRKKLAATLPETLFDALHADTDNLRKAGWNRPPGSCWVDYVRPANAFDSVHPAARPARARSSTGFPTVARYAVTGTVVPRLTEALRIGERARQFLMGWSKKINNSESASPVFSGKNPDGSRLDDSHQHAHFLCEAAGGGAKITHLNVYAPMGFTVNDERALARFTRTWGDDGHDLQFVLLGIGHAHDFGGMNEKAGQSASLAESKIWISRTPFVLTRHLKIRGKDRADARSHAAATERELIAAVRFELSNRSQFHAYLDDIQTTPILQNGSGTYLGGTQTPWLQFTRTRKTGGGSNAGAHGYGFRLAFSDTVSGPIALGYGCHFGLGQFVSTNELKPSE